MALRAGTKHAAKATAASSAEIPANVSGSVGFTSNSIEAEMIVNGHSKDVLIDTNGAMVEAEEQVAMDALPADVKAGLQARAGEGKLVKVETVTKKGKLVAYEAQVAKSGKKSEVQVGPDGKPLDHEE